MLITLNFPLIILGALAPNGRVLLALVLPYSHYVEKSKKNQI